ncbi:MAG: tetratricopeptide repeat protein [Xanthomonadales bacterium]|nr:tetratricopeptide repeat protein [Xanthomonadales bacterium]
MNFPGLARTVLCASALLLSGAAFAAKKEKVENEFPNATRAEPKVGMSEREQRELMKATDLVNDGKGSEALPIIDKVLSGSKLGKYAEAYALQLKGRAYWDEDKSAEALAATTKAIELDSLPNAQHFGLIYQVAQMHVQDEKYADALTWLERWEKEAGKTTADELALKGNVLYRLERYKDAIPVMKQAIAASDKPNDSWNQILMACYFELDQYDEAAALIQQQLAKSPNDFKLMKQLATVYVNGDKYPQAIEVLSKARAQGLITSPDDYLQLAKLYANADKPKEAVETLRDGTTKGIVKPTVDALRLEGDLCSQYDDDACAIAAYQKASPLATDGNVDYQLGYLLYYADRGAEAKEAFTRAISKGGLRQEGEAYVLRGDVLSEAGDSAGAMADWRKAATFPSAKVMADQRIKAASTGVKLKRTTKK